MKPQARIVWYRVTWHGFSFL